MGNEANPHVYGEPYFQDEPAAELGASLENFIMNGKPEAFGTSQYKISAPIGALFKYSWPTWMPGAGSGPFIDDTEEMRNVDLYPVPVEYCERLCQDAFWNSHVPKYGSSALHLGPLTHGRKFRVDPNNPHVSQLYEPQLYDTFHYQFPITANMSQAERDSALIQQKTSTLAHRVSAALQATVSAEAAVEMDNLANEVFDDLDYYGLPDEEFDFSEPPVGHLPEPARYNDIRNFLLAQRTVLALDTLDGAIPENTLLAYVNRESTRLNLSGTSTSLGDTVTREEFREFLRYCSIVLKELFE